MDAWIWAITEGGWEWIKECLMYRGPRMSYGYSIPRFPQKEDFLVFYSDKKLYGRVVVAESGRQVTSKDIEKEPELKEWKNVMFLDGKTLRMFDKPVPIEDVADQIEALKGKTGKSLTGAVGMNPKISLEEYKKIVEKGYANILKEFLPI